MSGQQLDLLADLEQEQADDIEAARRRAGDFTWLRDGAAPTSCRFCRTAGVLWQMRRDHGIDGWHRLVTIWQERAAQHTVGNHVRYYARALRDRDQRATGDTDRARPFDEDRCRHLLAERTDRARELRIDVDAILAEIGAAP